MTTQVFDQIKTAYQEMAAKALYRPAAPSDGCGNITVPLEQLNLTEEEKKYAQHWWKEEDRGEFWIGCADFHSRKATIFAIEAARNMCAGVLGNETALRLLKMAVAELEQVISEAS